MVQSHPRHHKEGTLELNAKEKPLRLRTPGWMQQHKCKYVWGQTTVCLEAPQTVGDVR